MGQSLFLDLFPAARGVTEIGLQFADILFANVRNQHILPDDVADVHVARAVHGIGAEGYRHIVVAVELFADDAGTEGVAVQADHQVQHRGAVVGLDGAGVFVGAEDFLRKIEGACIALLKGKAGIFAQFVKRDGGLARQRMPRPESPTLPTH